MKQFRIIYWVSALFIIARTASFAASVPDTLHCSVELNRSAQTASVTLNYPSTQDSLMLTFPAWTPGYYQIMDYGQHVRHLNVTVDGMPITCTKENINSWKLKDSRGKLTIKYTVTAATNFVASSFVSQDHSYLMPASIVPFFNNLTEIPVVIDFELEQAERIATALAMRSKTRLAATTLDELYDSPILIGKNLKELRPFYVQGKKHRFVTVTEANFDTTQFQNDLQKIVTSATDVIGDIPYESYIFLAIGSGNGGLEHLTSTAFSFDDASLRSRNGQLKVYSFLAHEYFHHYNVKRIRPIALGPFDYKKENPTTELWISEGITVYYDHLLLSRSGISTTKELLEGFSEVISGFQSDAGKHFQTLEQASFNTWSDGPFGQRSGRDTTISIYEKGAIVGLLIDLQIIFSTNGKKRLDDLMRYLYQTYYVKQQRGFTRAEFRAACEHVAGSSMGEVFNLIDTTQPIPYNDYFNKAGLVLNSSGDEFILSELSKKSKRQSTVLKKWMSK